MKYKFEKGNSEHLEHYKQRKTITRNILFNELGIDIVRVKKLTPEQRLYAIELLSKVENLNIESNDKKD